MNKQILISLFSILIIQFCAGQNRQMVITIDDLPAISRLKDAETYQSITTGILNSLKKYKAPGIGFVNENKLEMNGKVHAKREDLLRQWLNAGMELGNHAYSHKDFHRVDLEEFTEDVLKGERITKKLLAEKGMKMRYFRHPFLHSGNSPEKKAGLESFLKEHNYIPAPVTIDNSEWIFARAYDNALIAKDENIQHKIGGAYLAYMEAKIAFYEGQSKKLFQREISQILLIHANTINRDYLGELLKMMKDRGYSFITLEEALKDPAYDSKDEFTGIAGITWLDRWAITRKMPRDFYQGEPPAPKFIQDYAGIRE